MLLELFLLGALRLPPPRCSIAAPAADVLLYVDPLSHQQASVESAVLARGASLHILSRSADMAGREFEDGSIVSLVPSPGEEATWALDTLPANAKICGVLCGDDSALADAERLAHALCPDRANGVNAARRDKYLMNEVLRAAGVAATQQVAPRHVRDVRDFIERAGLPVVLKPRRGVASILVGLATSEQEATSIYEALATAPSGGTDASGGAAIDGLPVVQECLDGREWIVDTVSRDGQHKIAALWRYDKGSANGAPFVYFGIEARGMEGCEALHDYALQVLDALEWRWGPCHLEVMMTSRGTSAAPEAAHTAGP